MNRGKGQGDELEAHGSTRREPVVGTSSPCSSQHGGAAVSVLHHLNSLEESADETKVGA